MNSMQEYVNRRNNELDRELTEVLMEISDTAEQAAMNIMILRKIRKSKGVKHYVKAGNRRAGCRA